MQLLVLLCSLLLHIFFHTEILTHPFFPHTVKAIRNVTQLFSELLYLSVTSLAADSARVIRIVVGRSEVRLSRHRVVGVCVYGPLFSAASDGRKLISFG